MLIVKSLAEYVFKHMTTQPQLSCYLCVGWKIRIMSHFNIVKAMRKMKVSFFVSCWRQPCHNLDSAGERMA